MSLSITKLEEFLYKNNFNPISYFCFEGYCFMLEANHNNSQQSFYIYIPSRYNFKIDKKEERPIHILNTINLTFDTDFVDDEQHKEQPVRLNQDKEKLENILEYNYKKNIDLKNVPQQDILALKEIHRQLKRLKGLVENINYKLCIIYKNFLTIIRRSDNSIEFYTIQNIKENSFKKLGIVTDLEVMFDKKEKIIEDINLVRNNVYTVLQKNQGLHTQILLEMTKQQKDIFNIGEKLNTNIITLDININKLENLFNTIQTSENKIFQEIQNLEVFQSGNGIQTDISKMHSKTRLENELTKIEYLKNELGSKLNELRTKKENLLLNFDNIFFDNTIMFDLIIKNFAKLKDFA